jgi:hypothetical protein
VGDLLKSARVGLSGQINRVVSPVAFFNNAEQERSQLGGFYVGDTTWRPKSRFRQLLDHLPQSVRERAITRSTNEAAVVSCSPNL